VLPSLNPSPAPNRTPPKVWKSLLFEQGCVKFSTRIKNRS
jgi:hypothetical protein